MSFVFMSLPLTHSQAAGGRRTNTGERFSGCDIKYAHLLSHWLSLLDFHKCSLVLTHWDTEMHLWALITAKQQIVVDASPRSACRCELCVKKKKKGKRKKTGLWVLVFLINLLGFCQKKKEGMSVVTPQHTCRVWVIDRTEAGSGKLTLCVCVSETQSCKDTSVKCSAYLRLGLEHSFVGNISTRQLNKGKWTLWPPHTYTNPSAASCHIRGETIILNSITLSVSWWGRTKEGRDNLLFFTSHLFPWQRRMRQLWGRALHTCT